MPNDAWAAGIRLTFTSIHGGGEGGVGVNAAPSHSICGCDLPKPLGCECDANLIAIANVLSADSKDLCDSF